MDHHRVILVGAGPIGIELHAVLKRMGLDPLHLEAGAVGQTITWYPKQARFFSSPERIAIAGVPLTTPDQTKATREQYLAYLRAVVQQFDLKIATYESVRRLARDEDAGAFTMQTSKRNATCEHLVLAIGDMHLPRELGIEGEDLPHVSHYFDEPHAYFGRKLMIVGGRNSAAEAALRCQRAGAKVTISYRRDAFDEKSIKYWLLPELKALIKAGEIKFYPNTVPTRITDTHVELASTKGTVPLENGTVPFVEADHVLLLTGYRQDKTLFEMAGIDLVGENRAPSFDPETMQTNVPNCYIAGTAAAGTQERFKLFIENCHSHVTRIAKAITGEDAPIGLVNQAAKTFGLEES